MRRLLYVVAVVMLLSAAPVFAQGPFTDVPTDHWAYDAVNLLQKDGYIIGYPDGTFGGKRAITRYEFAVAIARIIAQITGQGPGPGPNLSEYVKKSELPDFSQFATKSEIPDVSQLATKAEVQALRKLLDEFRDELAALGVDVDALKRDVAALDARVAAIEAEQRRVKISGNVDVFGVATDHRSGGVIAYDRDERPIGFTSTLGRNISVVKDFDLNVVGRISTSTTANSTINYGNYLNYLAFVDDYAGGVFGPAPVAVPGTGVPVGNPAGSRPTSTGGRTAFSGGNTTVRNSLSDAFFPYYLYIDAGLCKGELVVGRFPLQFTPYILRMIDVDSYTSILKTDSGNYPVDGAKLRYNFGGADLMLYAAKHDTNDFLINGLTGQPTAGFYDQNVGIGAGFEPMHTLNGHAVGGLTNPITQSAGGRLVLGIPWSGNLGLSFYQAWSETDFTALAAYDQARVFGADLNIPLFSRFLFAGSWSECDTLARNGSGAGDIDFDNVAWDGKIGFGFGKLGIGLGYKDIGHNYAAAGSWDKVGRWTNPTNVKGPYGSFVYPITSNVNLLLDGEYLVVKDPTGNTGNARLTAHDRIIHAEGGIKWGLSRLNALALGYEWNRFNPSAAGDGATEAYLTIGWAHQLGDAGMQIGYQFIDYSGGSLPLFAYGPADYRAGLGVVQFGVSF